MINKPQKHPGLQTSQTDSIKIQPDTHHEVMKCPAQHQLKNWH